MIGLLLAYSAGKSVQRSRQRRAERPYGYEEFEFVVLISALAIGVVWPLHLCFKLTQWGVGKVLATVIASVSGFVGAITGVGYIIIGIIYSGIWLTALVTRGVAAEEAKSAEAESWEDDYRPPVGRDQW